MPTNYFVIIDRRCPQLLFYFSAFPVGFGAASAAFKQDLVELIGRTTERVTLLDTIAWDVRSHRMFLGYGGEVTTCLCAPPPLQTLTRRPLPRPDAPTGVDS